MVSSALLASLGLDSVKRDVDEDLGTEEPDTGFGRVLPLHGKHMRWGAGHKSPSPLSGIASFSAKWEELEPLYLPHGGVAGSQRNASWGRNLEEC